MTSSTPRALTIAGSDVSGGAGLEADLAMFEEYGVFGAAAITCIVTFGTGEAAGTDGEGEDGSGDSAGGFAHDIAFLDTGLVAKQLESALAIHRFDAIKSGMLGSVDTALMLSRRLRDNRLPYVFDPVLVCKGAGTMVDLKDLFVEHLVPQATVITPNLAEAALLAGAESLTSVEEMVEAAKAIHAQGAGTVVVKGGARLGGAQAVDVVWDGTTLTTLSSQKVNDELVNGAGCSFASSIAAGLATGRSVLDAVVSAKERVAHGIAASVPNATGVNSLNHAAWRVAPTPAVEVRVA
ncbi:hydroxymethylpyrimidine/phosphomethylpyrimidine kinase [Brevibacterium sp. BRM-1]|uniref:bifunctional hydroxymethylpyrimidine kinase/phosphomethylpyrimidine kinase n=1 Tax=Brevibacterium sp. BRM-1 TaxID=2999062 RepID=UPI00227F6E77|nr:hydroxymethylpyrimidine/phosphomethylpyrimidine kinase [Brevibacterium sp. BRM-1]WAL40812.1 hydroxymethylpyrimidine/phosphomethylpyrimidine kinase [Brevibacterium sp. BRM-1]